MPEEDFRMPGKETDRRDDDISCLEKVLEAHSKHGTKSKESMLKFCNCN